jgi:hypothetical protein
VNDWDDGLGLGMLVHFYILKGRDEDAAEAARRLLSLESVDALMALDQVEAAGRLAMHGEVRRLADEGMRAFPGKGGRLAFFTAVARLNLSETASRDSSHAAWRLVVSASPRRAATTAGFVAGRRRPKSCRKASYRAP